MGRVESHFVKKEGFDVFYVFLLNKQAKKQKYQRIK